ncbi:hypothetical protein HOY82DRAFT_579137 [Tuber indicum]|nr:hypothetical protein HOY82DRAFT_579137 [Tuber indicum]
MAASRDRRIADLYGQAEILCGSFEDILIACADPEYPGKIGRDEKKFIDHSQSVASVGWEEVHVGDGRAVDSQQEKGGGGGREWRMDAGG